MSVIYRVLRGVLFIFICLLVLTVGLGAFSRYFLHRSLYWSTEVPNFLFMWIVFLGSAVAYRDKKHIAFSILLERINPQIRRLVQIIGASILSAFFLFLVVTGTKVVSANLESETEALKIPYGIVYSCVPVSSLLMLLDSLRDVWGGIFRQAEGTHGSAAG